MTLRLPKPIVDSICVDGDRDDRVFDDVHLQVRRWGAVPAQVDGQDDMAERFIGRLDARVHAEFRLGAEVDDQAVGAAGELVLAVDKREIERGVADVPGLALEIEDARSGRDAEREVVGDAETGQGVEAEGRLGEVPGRILPVDRPGIGLGGVVEGQELHLDRIGRVRAAQPRAMVVGQDLQADVLREQDVEEPVHAVGRLGLEADRLVGRAGDVAVRRRERRLVPVDIRRVHERPDQRPAEAELEADAGRGEGTGGGEKQG